MPTVAFQGVEGAYSEQAAFAYFGRKVQTVPCSDFASVFKAVTASRVDFGVIPIENSLAGSLHQNYDLLLEKRVWIQGEYKLRVSHNLLVYPGVSLSDVRQVYSHPQALAQCAGYLRRLKGVTAVSYFDTAGSAQLMATEQRRDAAAIAGTQAAERYGLDVLATSIEDDPQNYTRFFVLSRPERKTALPAKTKQAYKTSIVFALKSIPGALHKSLSIFAIRDIDLFKIESRPIPGSPWQYLFYLDFAGKLNDEPAKRALAHLEEITTSVKVLGSYPRSP